MACCGCCGVQLPPLTNLTFCLDDRLETSLVWTGWIRSRPHPPPPSSQAHLNLWSRFVVYMHGLLQLKSTQSVLASSWNRRWFSIESRPGGDGTEELFLCYYSSNSKAEMPTNASALIPLRCVCACMGGRRGFTPPPPPLSTSRVDRPATDAPSPRLVGCCSSGNPLCWSPLTTNTALCVVQRGELCKHGHGQRNAASGVWRGEW
jgi:hypothetical protein